MPGQLGAALECGGVAHLRELSARPHPWFGELDTGERMEHPATHIAVLQLASTMHPRNEHSLGTIAINIRHAPSHFTRALHACMSLCGILSDYSLSLP